MIVFSSIANSDFIPSFTRPLSFFNISITCTFLNLFVYFYYSFLFCIICLYVQLFGKLFFLFFYNFSFSRNKFSLLIHIKDTVALFSSPILKEISQFLFVVTVFHSLNITCSLFLPLHNCFTILLCCLYIFLSSPCSLL